MKGTKNKKGVPHIPGMKNMRCQYCGVPAHLRSAEGIYKYGGNDINLYVCSNYPKCDSYVRVHPGTTMPVGILADAKLRALRVKAHQHFGELYKTGLMSKQEAYTWLAFALCLPPSQTHIGYFSEHYCNLVITESDKYLSTWNHKINKRNQILPVTGGEQYASQ
jgi:ssDNA-binding Zn-finger/Zn-ribbon topoisomerase 1